MKTRMAQGFAGFLSPAVLRPTALLDWSQDGFGPSLAQVLKCDPILRILLNFLALGFNFQEYARPIDQFCTENRYRDGLGSALNHATVAPETNRDARQADLHRTFVAHVERGVRNISIDIDPAIEQALRYARDAG